MKHQREATPVEQKIAAAWVARHRWTNPKDSAVEYEHALKILVFAAAQRSSLRGGKS